VVVTADAADPPAACFPGLQALTPL
jgi:hypothetical protein